MWSLILLSVISLAMATTEIPSPIYQMVTGNNRFSARLFHEVVKEQPGRSVVLSGYSAMAPLLLLGLGAVEDSQEELLQAAGFSNKQLAKNGYNYVRQYLNGLVGVELKVANRLYVTAAEGVNDTYRVMSKEVFGSDVESVDFSKSAEVAREVNEFVEEQTNHRIKNIASASDYNAYTKVVAINAVYFKGEWNKAFLTTFTSDFHISKDKTVKVPMMSQADEYNYAHSTDLQAQLVELPFIKGYSSVLIVLPDEVDGLATLLEKIVDFSKLVKAVKKMDMTAVKVQIPKFKIETETKLESPLQKVGVKKLFRKGEAKLHNVFKSQTDADVSSVRQKAYLDVNEIGVEAAASTQAVAVAAVMTDLNFVANRPFYLELRAGDITLFSSVYYGN